ncbi:MAG: xanthine phosphoribosyltransferase [Chloroflexi bacterium]|nr:xanthine phosphoribosyltransferase [Chloroflexota bacterium]MCL5074036.1 xanthine phosphoribosyltransferase [Chloroflexota bacterium]
MEELRQAILKYGQVLGDGILKVDAFLNHQIDCVLLFKGAEDLASRFRAQEPTKVLTAESSGITPAVLTGLALGVPVLYARKRRPITMPEVVYRRCVPSHTKGIVVDLMISPEFISPQDRVLIVDDFLATGLTIEALSELVTDAGAQLVGIGVVIEKTFEGGRERLAPLKVPIESLVRISCLDEGRITFAPP